MLQPKLNPASCHFSCVQTEIDHAPWRQAREPTHARRNWDDARLQPHQGVVRSLTAFGRSLCLGDPITERCEDWDTDTAAIISMGGWLWLLAVGLRWLIVKL
jgi:hypothetical protein